MRAASGLALAALLSAGVAEAQPPPGPPPAPAPPAPLPPAPPPANPPNVVILPPGVQQPQPGVALPPPGPYANPGTYSPYPYPVPYYPYPSDQPARPPREPADFTVRIDATATFFRIYDIPITTAEGTLGLGAEFPKNLAVYGTFTFCGGAQETGLAAFVVRAGGEVEGKLGRFRFGGGVSLGELILARATESSDTTALTLGLLARASFDLVQWGHHDQGGLYLLAKFRSDIALGVDAAPLLWGPSVGVGIRF